MSWTVIWGTLESILRLVEKWEGRTGQGLVTGRQAAFLMDAQGIIRNVWWIVGEGCTVTQSLTYRDYFNCASTVAARWENGNDSLAAPEDTEYALNVSCVNLQDPLGRCNSSSNRGTESTAVDDRKFRLDRLGSTYQRENDVGALLAPCVHIHGDNCCAEAGVHWYLWSFWGRAPGDKQFRRV